MAGSRKTQSVTDAIKVLQKDIEGKNFHRVYLLFGEERYLVMQYRDSILGAAVAEGDTMNLNIHREAGPDAGNVMDEALTMPFFADRRLVLLQDTGWFAPPGKGNGTQGRAPAIEEEKQTADGKKAKKSSKDSRSPQEIMADFIPTIPATTVVLFVESAVDRRGRLFKAVQKAGIAAEFTHPDEGLLRKWVLAKLGRHHIRITGNSLDRFLQRTGDDMNSIDAELNKLISYAGEGGELKLEAVEALVSAKLENRIFDMMEALGHRDRRTALALYDELLQLKESPMKILVLLTRQFNLLLQTKILQERGAGPAQMTEMLGLKSGWVTGKYIQQAKMFSDQQLREAVEDCAKTDERIKTGLLDQTMGVELLLIRYSR